MSKINVLHFYEFLERTEQIRREALALQSKYPDQGECIDAFIRIAEREGYPFTIQEFMEVMYEKAQEAGNENP